MKRHNGFTLVELLISITLGSLILLAATQLFIEGRDNHQYQAEWQELHQRGRHLLQFLSTELKKAGYPKNTFSGTPLTATDNDGEQQSDTLTLSYQDAQDCAGSAVTTILYYLQEGDLRCDGNGNASPTSQTLSSHIDGLQFRFGTDQDGDGSIDRYLSANEITDWQQVHTITIAVLLHSQLAVREQQDSTTYLLLDQQQGPFNDYYLRRVYQLTTQLRNH